MDTELKRTIIKVIKEAKCLKEDMNKHLSELKKDKNKLLSDA